MRLGISNSAKDFMLDSLTCNECKHKNICPNNNKEHNLKMSQCPYSIEGEAFEDRIDFDNLLN